MRLTTLLRHAAALATGSRTLIGVVGMPPDSDDLFTIAAEQVTREYKHYVVVRRLAGNCKNHVHARLIVNGVTGRGKCEVEVDLRLTGSSAPDARRIKTAIVRVLNMLA